MAFYTKHNPGATCLIIRDTWENLRRTTLAEWFHWFPPGKEGFGTWHENKRTFTWDTARTGFSGEVIFMGVESEADATKIASMPLAFVGIDEVSGAAGESSGVSEYVFDTAMAQLRQPGMNWYAAKLVQNNPDEAHWTYRRFVDPGTPPTPGATLLPLQQSGYVAWQTKQPENEQNLPPGYYEGLKQTWANRPDLVRRMVEGKYGFQQVGRAVTPEWDDTLHLARGLKPVKGPPLHLLYDGGLNPTCIITQITPSGHWLVLESFVGEDMGMFDLIEQIVKPVMASRYAGFTWVHVGDPNLRMREQSAARQSAAKVIIRELGGRFIPGPVDLPARVDPLRSVLGRTIGGRGVLQVDKDRARHVWYALRGGWHYHVQRSGVVGQVKKNEHSHPGDAMGYGASYLFPLGKLRGAKAAGQRPKTASFFQSAPHPGTSLGMAKKNVRLPKEARVIGGK